MARNYKLKVCQHIPLKALYLFGSYSKGGYTNESDIDVAVVIDDDFGNSFYDSSLLWKLGRQVSYLIEPVMLKEDRDNPLYADIIKTGILI